jgi:ornithine--oxo-acid transaminase
MGDSFWKGGFGSLLSGTHQVPFNNLTALEEQLRSKRYAGFFLEPIQGEGGIRVPDSDYLKSAEALCRRYGTLLILDEVQTGFFRTGKFLAAHHYGVEPDMVVLAKAMSGGLVPSGAVLMTDRIYNSVYGSLKRSLIHTSTFSENGLSMRVGLAVFDALDAENAGTVRKPLGHTCAACSATGLPASTWWKRFVVKGCSPELCFDLLAHFPYVSLLKRSRRYTQRYLGKFL